MESITANGANQFESGHKQLGQKREKYRISIRKDSIKTMLLQKRKDLVDSLRNHMVQHLKSMFVKISEQEVTQFIRNLKEEVKCSQFNTTLFQMRIDIDLVGTISDNDTTLENKIIAVDLLTQLARYSTTSDIAFVQPQIVDLLLSQMEKQSFKYELQEEYILSILQLLSVLVKLKCSQLHMRLLSIDFCGKVHRRLNDEILDFECTQTHGKQIYKFLSRIRAGLIATSYDFKFVKQSLEFLAYLASQYDNFDKESICQVLVSAIDSCPKANRKQLLNYLYDTTVLTIFDDIMEQRPNNGESLKILYVLEAMHDFSIQLVKIILTMIPFQFFMVCLKDPSQTLHQGALSIISRIMQPIMDFYEYSQENTQEIIDIVLNDLETSQCKLADCLRMIDVMTKGRQWAGALDILLNKGMITQLTELLSRETIKPDHIQKLLNTVENLIEQDKNRAEARIRRCLLSGGTCLSLEKLQQHEDIETSQRAERLCQELLAVDSKLSDQ